MPLIKEVYLTNEEAQTIAGVRDTNLEYMEQLLKVKIFARGNILKIKGEEAPVEQTVKLLEKIKDSLVDKKSLNKSEILKLAEQSPTFQQKKPLDTETILVDSKRKTIHPKSPNQKKYIQSIRNYDLVMGIGPAGTGKTYLAVACGIEMVKQGRFQKIILTRPALEAG